MIRVRPLKVLLFSLFCRSHRISEVVTKARLFFPIIKLTEWILLVKVPIERSLLISCSTLLEAYIHLGLVCILWCAAVATFLEGRLFTPHRRVCSLNLSAWFNICGWLPLSHCLLWKNITLQVIRTVQIILICFAFALNWVWVLFVLKRVRPAKKMAGILADLLVLVEIEVFSIVVHLLLIVEHISTIAAWLSLGPLSKRGCLCHGLLLLLLGELVEIVSRGNYSWVICISILIIVWTFLLKRLLLCLSMKSTIEE